MRCRLTVFIACALLGASCAHPSSPAKPPTTQSLGSSQDLPGLPNFGRVSEVLYRGAQPTERGFARLKQMGIKTVVDLRGASHRDDIDAFGFKYVHIPTNVMQIEPGKVIEFLRIASDPANQPVFVHCERGADRTGCYVAAYRMVRQGWSEPDAEAELPRFHFNLFWGNIRTYLRGLDPERTRRQLNSPTAIQAKPDRGESGIDKAG